MDHLDKSHPHITKEQELENYFIYTKYFPEMISRHHIKSGEIRYVSPSSEHLLKYFPQDLHGQSFYQYIHPDDREQVKEQLCHPFQSSGKVTYKLRRQSGEYVWVESIYKKKIEGVSNSISEDECFCITRNITDYKMAEEELKEEEDKYRTLVQHSNETIGMMSAEGFWIFINESGKRLLGITQPREVIGCSIFDFVHASQREHVYNVFQENRGSRHAFKLNNITIVRTDKETRQTEIDIIPTNYKHRRTLQVVITDITERMKTEELLQQTEKLSVIGHLAAGIAHEIRNPLTSIRGFTQLLKNNIDEKYSSIIMQELDRIETIVGDLLVLAKPEVIAKEEVDLIHLMKRMISLLQSQAIINNIYIEFDHENESLLFECEPNKIRQVFINIIKNSIDAMEASGGSIYITQKINRDGAIEIQIKDEGNGIPEERLEKIGEPFYSTKEKGTGLGLMICDRIVKSHGGTLSIHSTVGKGTTITITFPFSQ
ncbi:hypothetical protein GCM10011391_17850 [Pullulanibacillus camelliae]|uniref:histidine kinase n=1 Tax=Pullulanibacillus camelliae TaxID=1707096 RepID=A0A8J2VMY6_9BACL|nr:ATP-binding protein [Pullulanibacillus camelliae]GGE39477.1 hypothetical protein GCM10011391_17850 [Pullulanibacillus camelliae]